jgi:hypothetical protein
VAMQLSRHAPAAQAALAAAQVGPAACRAVEL